jgi:sortase (surface protein transpeptidase)
MPAPATAPEPAVNPPAAVSPAGAPRPAATARTVVSTPLRLRIPDLGISQTTRDYPCSRSEPPANYVYRWGCAGRNNLYLLGHAYSVFKPLHDAYASGRLRVGMVAYWTDAAGRTVTYRVSSWRVVKPTDASWAIASQPVPSMTLQTCFGPNSEHRLLVRLVAG